MSFRKKCFWGKPKKKTCKVCDKDDTCLNIQHSGCVPCSHCRVHVKTPRLIRIRIIIDGKSDLSIPWDCPCLLTIGHEISKKAITKEIIRKILEGEVHDSEFPDFLAYVACHIDLLPVLETMEYYRMLTKSYSDRDLYMVRELRNILVDKCGLQSDASKPGGGWSEYPSHLKN